MFDKKYKLLALTAIFLVSVSVSAFGMKKKVRLVTVTGERYKNNWVDNALGIKTDFPHFCSKGEKFLITETKITTQVISSDKPKKFYTKNYNPNNEILKNQVNTIFKKNPFLKSTLPNKLRASQAKNFINLYNHLL